MLRIAIMPAFERFLWVGIASLALASVGLAQSASAVPPHGKLVPLFNGKNFAGFDTLLEKHGMIMIPTRCFRLRRGCCISQVRNLEAL
jgi:hypothetical protein